MKFHYILNAIKTTLTKTIYNKKKVITILAVISIIIFYLIVVFSRWSRNVYPEIKPLPLYDMEFNTLSKHMDAKAAISLYRKIPILCVVIVQRSTSNLDILYDTWLKHCNRVCCLAMHFVDNWDVVHLKRMDTVNSLLRPALDYLIEYLEFDDIDWIVIVESNTYTVVENLRYTLSNYDKYNDLCLIYGSREEKENSAVASVVLSKTAMKQITNIHIPNDVFCNTEVLMFRRNSLIDCFKSRNINFTELTYSVYYRELIPSFLIDNRREVIRDISNITKVNIPKHIAFFQDIDQLKMLMVEFVLYQLYSYGIIDNTIEED